MSTSVPAARRDDDLPESARTGRRVPKRRGSGSGGARTARMRGPLRTLTALLVLTLALFAGLGAAHQWGSPRAQLTPLLGLDLAGGRQMVIEPVTEEGESVSPEQVEQAIDIIRRRVDGSGVAEAEVSRMGATNVAVAIPGNPTPAQLESLSRSSQMRFRPVLVAAPVIPGQEPAVDPYEIPLPSEQLEQEVEQLSPPPAVEDGADDAPTGTDDAASTDENRGGERVPTSATEGPADDDAATSGADDATRTAEPEAPAANPSDLAQITPELQEAFVAADCTDDAVASTAAGGSASAPIVACNPDGTEKYILGPAEVSGANLTDATAGMEQTQAGYTGAWQVVLDFDDVGTEQFAAVTQRLVGYPQGTAQNRFAMVLDGEVISAPSVNSVIPDGGATITGGFTPEAAENLANQLKFGALPMSFEVQTSEQISPTLGGEQLRWGLIAGAIGMLLVFLYMLVQYHALGLVTIGSLVVAALLTYGAITLLGWSNNFRLTMAGVTGVIVAIGVTADSFIVYFERVRDEVRAGRPLRYAVDTGWARARRTIIISDAVNLIAAGVLYWLSESGVKAFAFTLGLTTVIDLLVVMMFTHPVVSILANTRFFGEGRRWSGMDPEHLGAKRGAYLGRGQFRDPQQDTDVEALPDDDVAELALPGRRRHTREELEGGVV